MSELLKKIRSRGYWKVVIHPARFIEKRVANIADLYPILEKSSVQLRGWDFPHLNHRTRPQFGLDWIEQEFEWEYYLELWRFYQSGQFVHFSGMVNDWSEQVTRWNPPEDWEPGAFLDVADALLHFMEVFEFAGRLSMTEAGDEEMHLEITVAGIKGRILKVNEAKYAGFLSDMKASIQELPYSIDLSRTQLITEKDELALKAAVELFQRFGWNPSPKTLKSIQEELRGYRSHTSAVVR